MELQTDSDRELIRQAFAGLMEACRKRSPDEGELRIIRQAFDLADEAHRGTRRKSGEPYIMHPIAVARIVVDEIGLGYKSVSAALLHDVVEDTDYTIKDIQRLFGAKIAELVDGLTKIDGVIKDANQAENFKRILLTLNNDVRVVLIKLADRLHNMRTIGAMPERKRARVIGESKYIYALLALRLGLYAIKTELENIWLQYTLPDEYSDIQTLLAETEASRYDYIETFVAPVKERLHARGMSFELVSRTKSVYSIWEKMRRKNARFDEIYDLFAIRIIFDPWPELSEISQCYEVQSIIGKIYPTVHGRTRNWVVHPKANGYEALHETFMGPLGTPVEVQIRSRRMDDIARHGIAAHWRYKTNNSEVSEIDKWLEHIRSILENPHVDAATLLDEFHADITSADMYLFTPKGESKILPRGATVLDFAYYVHSAIGHRAIAGKVNHELVALNHPLKSGDQVEVITAETQAPAREWLDWVVTTKAKAFIHEALKADTKNHFRIGRELIDAQLEKLQIQPSGHIYTKLARNYGVNNKEELFSKAGAGVISLSEFEKILKSNSETRSISYWGIRLPRFIFGGSSAAETTAAAGEEIDRKKTYILQEGTDYQIAACCKPIPGDEVTGFVDADRKHVTIHKKDCEEAVRLAAQQGYRIVQAQWNRHVQQSFLSRIAVRGVDRLGILNELTNIITGQLSVNIRKVLVESHDGIFEGYVDLYVHNLSDLNRLMSEVKTIRGITLVKRAEFK